MNIIWIIEALQFRIAIIKDRKNDAETEKLSMFQQSQE